MEYLALQFVRMGSLTCEVSKEKGEVSVRSEWGSGTWIVVKEGKTVKSMSSAFGKATKQCECVPLPCFQRSS